MNVFGSVVRGCDVSSKPLLLFVVSVGWSPSEVVRRLLLVLLARVLSSYSLVVVFGYVAVPLLVACLFAASPSLLL